MKGNPFFGLLLAIASVSLIIGLIEPTVFSRFFKGEITREKIAKFFSIATLVFLVLTLITGPDTAKEKTDSTETEQQVTRSQPADVTATPNVTKEKAEKTSQPGSVAPEATENQFWDEVRKAIEAVDANEEIQAKIRAQAKKPSILTAKSDVYVSTNLDCMQVILMSVKQNNLAGLREAISMGLEEGVLDMLGESEQVEPLEYVNDEIFKLRPVGSDRIYYSIRIFFSPEEPK